MEPKHIENHEIIDPASTGWHLDKRIPIIWMVSTFLLLAGQTYYLGYYVSKNDAHLDSLDRADVRHEVSILNLSGQHDAVVELKVNIEHMKEDFRNMKDEIHSMNGKLDKAAAK
jgi:hypothetical protein